MQLLSNYLFSLLSQLPVISAVIPATVHSHDHHWFVFNVSLCECLQTNANQIAPNKECIKTEFSIFQELLNVRLKSSTPLPSLGESVKRFKLHLFMMYPVSKYPADIKFPLCWVTHNKQEPKWMHQSPRYNDTVIVCRMCQLLNTFWIMEQ